MSQLLISPHCGRLTRAHDQEHSEQIFKKNGVRREPVLGAFPDDLEWYVKLKTVRKENGHGYH